MHRTAGVHFIRSITLQQNNMKITRTALTTALLGLGSTSFQCRAFLTVPTSPSLSLGSTGASASMYTSGWFTGTRISKKSFVSISSASEDTDRAKTDDNAAVGKMIAEGTIISFYGGGLVAVRVSDDLSESLSASTPTLTAGITPDDTTSGVFGGNIPKKMENAGGGGSAGDDLVGNKVIFPNGSGGIVVAQRFPVIFALSDTEQIENTDGAVTILDSKAIISVGPRIMDCFGRPILEDGSPDTQTTSEHESSTLKRPMLAAIPQVKDIALINTPLLTGTTMVDALAPLGKGQNMLVIGHDLGTMRGFSTDFLKTQLALGKTKCVYGITNGKDRSAIIAEFRQAGILDDVTIVSASSQDKDEVTLAAEAIAVGATACAIGEAYALSEGLDALVIVDTLDEHKVLWDATTRVLVDVYGAEAVVQDDRKGAASSEMRAFYSGLIQRAAKYKKNRGGGSLSLSMICSIPSMQGETKDGEEEPIFSAKDFEGCNDKIKARLDILINKKIPLTASILRKINLPIPSVSESKRRFILQHIDDLISMSDGQIWLDETLSDAGQRPPLDPQRSITRVGIGADTISRADAPAVRQIVGGLRLDLSQALCMDGAEANAASEKQVRMRNAWLLAMHQEAGRGGRTLGETCVTLLAAKVGAFDDCIDKGGFAGTKAGNSVVMNLLEHVKNTAPALLKDIDETLDMSDESMNELEGVIKSFF